MATRIVNAYYDNVGPTTGFYFEANAGSPAATFVQLGDYIIATIVENPGGAVGANLSNQFQTVPGSVSGTVGTLKSELGGPTVLLDDSRVAIGQIVVIYANNPDLGQFHISSIPAQLVTAIGCEGFSTFTELLDRTDVQVFGTHYADQITIEPLVVLNTANEKWIRINDSRNEYGFQLEDDTFTPPNGLQREVEVSAAVYLDPTYAQGTSIEFLSLELIDTSATLNQLVLNFEPDNSGALMETNLVGLVDGANTALGSLTHAIPLVAGTLFYLTIRIRSESAVDARDGLLEMWVNGQLVRTSVCGTIDDPITSFIAAGTGVWNVSIKGTGVELNGDLWSRNISVWNGFTSDDGVAPAFLHVVDHKLNTVTGTVTNVGGVDESDSVTDADDATYVETSTPGNAITLSQTGSIDPLLDSRTLYGFVVRNRVSRGSLSTNTIDVQPTDGTNPLGPARTHVISTVEPSRENLNVAATVVQPTAKTPTDATVILTNET